VPAASTLVVVGDVGESVRPALERAFGAWTGPASPPPTPAVEVPAQLRKTTVWLVDKPGAAQSAIWVARPGPSWEDPHYHATEVMNTLLGGSFTSRLNDNLREQHGYTYGAFSILRRYRSGGLFVALADVQADKTGPALAEFVKELERIREPATPAELERARRYDALGYAAGFETTTQVARHLVEQAVYGLPDDFFSTYVPKALAVDGSAVEHAARATIDPGRVAIVVVGDRSKVEAPVRALKLGEVKTLTVEDVMGPPPKIE
jgi:zinc protease